MGATNGRPRWVTVLLVVVPLWLVVSAAVGLWVHLRPGGDAPDDAQATFARAVSVPAVTDDLRKIVGIIGERNVSSEKAAANLRRMASMIEGTLGPGNTGYTVRRERGPAEWPILHVVLPGKNSKIPAVWVAASYDSPPGSKGGEANASGLAASLAAAQALAGEKFRAAVHFVFVPHANDPHAPVVETASALADLMAKHGPPGAVLCVEAMGGGEELWLTSRETGAAPLSRVEGLGKVVGAEVICLEDDIDLASVLFEMDLPAVRVATRERVAAGEADDRVPFGGTVAAAADRLVELIRRTAGDR